MRTHILSALFTGMLSLAAVGCGDTGGDSSLGESALKKGTLDDAGVCSCDKGKKEKSDKDAGKGAKDKDAGKDEKDEKDEDAGKSSNGQGGGKSDGGKSDEDHGKSDEDHGKGGKDGGADEDEAGDEEAVDDEEFEALKITPDGGAKVKKPKTDKGDCTC
jgi:hypothetical protein